MLRFKSGFRHTTNLCETKHIEIKRFKTQLCQRICTKQSWNLCDQNRTDGGGTVVVTGQNNSINQVVGYSEQFLIIFLLWDMS